LPKITKRVVDALRKNPDRDVFVWDNELRGFGVRMKPSGVRTFLIQYRNAHGRTRRMVIGKVGTLTPEEARGLAREKLGEVAKGGDPSATRKAAREAATVTEICDWYLKEAKAGRILGRRGRAIKTSTLAMDESRISQHVKPLLGAKIVRGLSIRDLEDFQAEVAAGRTAKKRTGRGGATSGGNAVAGRTLGMLRTLFEHAVRSGLIPANPARGVRVLAGKRRLTRLSLEQLAKLGKAMRGVTDENVTGLAAIRFIALTGFRRHEALGIKAAWVLEAGGIVFPDTKSGAQVRPIGIAAMKVLEEQRKRAGSSPWLFPADRGKGHFIGVRKVLNRVAKTAGFTCTPHLLRHTFSSVAGDLGYSELTIAGLLGHSAKGVTQSYVHMDQSLVAAADQISTCIADTLDSRPPEPASP
jgi:integrase